MALKAVRFTLTAVTVLLLSLSVIRVDAANCGPNQLCPADVPCCSQYGQCGVGVYCLGGCDPLFSHSLDSCVPEPICQDKTYQFTSLDGIVPNTKFLGNASTADWVSTGEPVVYTDPGSGQKQVLLTMAQGTVGTLLASVEYVWYGKITATMRSSRGQGVVTAFIMLSDVKDEIDFEFVGAYLGDVQSNYYFQGIPIYMHELNLTVKGDTFSTYHTYEIDWTPDSLTWYVDGVSARTVKRDETFNATTNQFYYPQTPARVQLSLWPAGLSTNNPGTVEWAGGLIDWNSPDVQNVGYYYAMIQEVSIQCYPPPPGAFINGSKSYIYDNSAGTNNTVEITDDVVVLGSILGTGTDPDVDAQVSSSAAAAATAPPTVPGLSGAGTGQNGNRGGAAASSGGGSTPTTVAIAPSSSQSSFHGFSQGGTNIAPPLKSERAVQGSMLAVLMAIVGMLIL